MPETLDRHECKCNAWGYGIQSGQHGMQPTAARAMMSAAAADAEALAGLFRRDSDGH